MELSSGVTEMASIQPMITYAIGTHSFGFGFSSNMTRVTTRLIIMDMLPNTPMVAGGNHVRAKGSGGAAAADSTSAIINKGRQYNGLFSVGERLINLVLGSLKLV